MAKKEIIRIKQRRVNKRNYFYCYNWDVADFLRKEGFETVTKGRAMNTNNVFWVFESSPDLTNALDEYKSKKKTA